MISNNPRVSFVIIAYNEEVSIANCLESITKQTIKPFEIILVDNNSKDATVKIAQEFKVTIVREKEQGVMKARLTGLNAAKGDIIIAIDVDTLVPRHYVKDIIDKFRDESVNALTTYGKSRKEYIIPNSSKFWSWCYFTFTKGYFGYQLLWGANMVIRKKAWIASRKFIIAPDTLYIHDDQEISLALATAGYHVTLMKNYSVSVDMEGLQRFSKFNRYFQAMVQLKRIDSKSERRHVKTRLPKISSIKRAVYLLLSSWTIVVFYFGTILYSTYCRLTNK